MIQNLEFAGLGFYVRATETQQKLGMFANALSNISSGIPLLRDDDYNCREDTTTATGLSCAGPTPEYETPGV